MKKELLNMMETSKNVLAAINTVNRSYLEVKLDDYDYTIHDDCVEISNSNGDYLEFTFENLEVAKGDDPSTFILEDAEGNSINLTFFGEV